jgi:HK97 family phage major capsid protein
VNIEKLQADLDGVQNRARAMLATMKTRPASEDERTTLTDLLEQGRAIKARLDRARGDLAMSASIEQLTGGMSSMPSHPGGGRSLGNQFVESAAYRYIRETSNNRPQAFQTPVIELNATTLSESGGSGGPLVLADQQPGILPLPTRRLVVADLIAPGTTTSNLISFMRETAFTNAAAAVLEAGLKPESALVFENATSKVEKIAHWIPVTDEILQDVAQMSSYIDGRMRHGVDLAEDDQLLNGSGVSPNLRGFLHLTAPAAPIARVAEVNAEAIYKQIAAIEAATNMPVTGIVMNGINWMAIDLLHDSTGNYIGGGGPFQSPRTPTLWGRPVAITSAIPAGTALVGAFQGGAQLFKHGGVRVDVSNSHASFFINNLLAVRAEIREALAVYRESAFGLVTNLS